MKLATFAAALLITSQAQAINRCSAPDGSTIFQDAPCASGGSVITVKPASGKGPASKTSADEPPQSEAQRIEANITKSQKERRLRDLTDREVPAAQTAVQRHRTACQQEQQRLEAMKYRYVQNLYGKTDAAQAAAEQAAAASRCDLEDRQLRSDLQRLQDECKSLGGCN